MCALCVCMYVCVCVCVCVCVWYISHVCLNEADLALALTGGATSSSVSSPSAGLASLLQTGEITRATARGSAVGQPLRAGSWPATGMCDHY